MFTATVRSTLLRIGAVLVMLAFGAQVTGSAYALAPAKSCWLGGILIDQSMQRRGYGRQAVLQAIAMLKAEWGYQDFALSYEPANLAARTLYQRLGFVETDEREGAEVVARLWLAE